MAAVAIGAMGIAACSLGWGGDRWILYSGILMLLIAPMVWLGLRYARVPAALVALIATWPLVWGTYGLTVIAGEYNDCRDGRIGPTASLTSYPADYCSIVDWGERFGIGLGLVGVGLTGLFVLIVVLKNGDHFRRTLRVRARSDAAGVGPA